MSKLLSLATCQSDAGKDARWVSLPGSPEGVLTLSKSLTKNVFFSRHVDLLVVCKPVEAYLSPRVVVDLLKVVVP